MAEQNHRSPEDILPAGRLPGDLIESILTNLPVKSLLKFKAVSKSWYCSISSRRFKKMHLIRQSRVGNKLLLSSLNNDPHQSAIPNKIPYEFGILSDKKKNDYWKIPPLLSFVGDGLCYFYVCYGLVCARHNSCSGNDEPGGFVLWNPATRKYRSIISQPFNYMGIGYVEATDDYKIVVWSHSDTQASVYSLNLDFWKKLDNDVQQFPIGHYSKQNSDFINGRLHWLSHTCTCCYVDNLNCVNVKFSIVAFDVADEVVSCLGIPDNRPPSPGLVSCQTLVFKGCLSVVFFSSEMEIWVMKEYGVQGSWFKQCTIQESPAHGPSIISWNDCEVVFTRENPEDEECDDELCDESSERLMFYDPFSKEEYCLEFESLMVLEGFNYIECLASVR